MYMGNEETLRKNPSCVQLKIFSKSSVLTDYMLHEVVGAWSHNVGLTHI
jgi:hypothetical protein